MKARVCKNQPNAIASSTQRDTNVRDETARAAYRFPSLSGNPAEARRSINLDHTSLLGDHSEREPPDPIPNSEVKPLSADDSVAVCHAKVGNCQAPFLKSPSLTTRAFFCPAFRYSFSLRQYRDTNPKALPHPSFRHRPESFPHLKTILVCRAGSSRLINKVVYTSFPSQADKVRLLEAFMRVNLKNHIG